MSRTRTRIMPSANFWMWGYPYPTNVVKIPDFMPDLIYSGLRKDYNAYSCLSDNVSTVSPPPFNACSHTRYLAATFGGSTEYSFSPPTPPLAVQVNGGLCYEAPSVPSSGYNWAGMIDELASRLDGKITGSCAALVTLRELAQTVAMIRNPFNLLKADWRVASQAFSASRLAKKAANIWLEGLYGWKSLYTDVSSVSQASAGYIDSLRNEDLQVSNLQRLSTSQVVTGTRANVYAGTITSDSAWSNQLRKPIDLQFNDPSVRILDIRYKGTARVSCQQLVQQEHGLRWMRKLAQYGGFSNWRELRDVLWEITPFSFVVDWFIDTRGLWSTLNLDRLHQADVRRFGYSTKTETWFRAEALQSWNYATYRIPNDTRWRYKTPTTYSGSLVYPSTSAGCTTYYSRTPGDPPAQSFYNRFSAAGLSVSQMASGISLIAQRTF